MTEPATQGQSVTAEENLAPGALPASPDNPSPTTADEVLARAYAPAVGDVTVQEPPERPADQLRPPAGMSPREQMGWFTEPSAHASYDNPAAAEQA